MKTVIIVSVVTFLLIFGGLFLTSNVMKSALRSTDSGGDAEELVATERAFTALALERDRIQREKEELLTIRQMIEAEEKTLDDTRELLLAVLRELQAEQEIYSEEKERLAGKLAKMYEAMKPAAAAPIISALEMDVILEIVQRMKEKKAAKILAYLDSGLAAQISLRMSIAGSQ